MKIVRFTHLKFLRCLLLTTLCIALVGSSVQAQQGVAPVITPLIGFGVDGDALANFPTPGPFSQAGDWFSDPLYPGPGTTLFNMATPDPYDMTYPLSIHYNDPWEGVDPTIFTKSSKIYDPYDTTFTWGGGHVPNKNEINNASAHFTWGNPAIGGIATDLWCIFAADRMVNNGDAYIDFEFLQNPVMMVYNADSTAGYFQGYGPDKTRTVGDIVITIQFENGGTTAIPVVHRWEFVGPDPDDFTYVEQPLSNYTGAILITSNTDLTVAPWMPYGQPAYLDNQYAEGAVNLSAVMGFGEGECGYLSTVFVRTKTSQSTSAVLKDFPGAPYQANISLDDLEVFCPTPVYLPECSDMADITTAYNAWVDGFYYTGGNEPIVENIGDIPLLPVGITCGDTIYFTYEVTDTCNQIPVTCESAFGVAADENLPVINDGPDIALEGCNPAWPATVTNTWTDNCGGSGTVTGVPGDVTDLPGAVCMQYRDYTFNVEDDCGNDALPVVKRVTRHWDMTAPVINDGPDIALEGCNPAWPATVTNTWTDNCGGSGTVTGVPGAVTDLPGAICMQYRDYTFNVDDDCGNHAATVIKRITRHWDMTAPVINDGPDIALEGCNPAWPATVTNTWSDNCGGSGTVTGVPGAITDLPGAVCMQYRDYTFNVEDDCGNDALPVVKRVTRHWDMTAPVINDGPDIAIEGCNPPWPDIVTNTWTDNCGGSGTINGVAGEVMDLPGAICTQYRDYTFNVEDDCGNDALPVVKRVTRHWDMTAPVLSSELVDLTFECMEDIIIPEPVYEDNCTDEGDIEIFCEVTGAPDDCDYYEYPEGETELCFWAVDDCGNTSAITCITVTILPCGGDLCTLTQGAYGNEGGYYCTGESTLELLDRLLLSGPLTIGVPVNNRTFTIPITGSQCVIDILPGGGPSVMLPTGAWGCGNFGTLLSKQGRLKNSLLAQTITLGLNMRLDADLADLVFEGPEFYTLQSSECGENIDPYPLPGDTMWFTGYDAMPQSIMDAFGGDPTVLEIYNLANDALGGIPEEMSLSDIEKAVGMINDALDECRFIYFLPQLRSNAIGNEESGVTLEIAPNPFNHETNISYTLQTDSKVTLEIYNTQGVRIHTIYEGGAKAGITYTHRYATPDTAEQMLFVVLRTNTGTVSKRMIKTN